MKVYTDTVSQNTFQKCRVFSFTLSVFFQPFPSSFSTLSLSRLLLRHPTHISVYVASPSKHFVSTPFPLILLCYFSSSLLSTHLSIYNYPVHIKCKYKGEGNNPHIYGWSPSIHYFTFQRTPTRRIKTQF